MNRVLTLYCFVAMQILQVTHSANKPDSLHTKPYAFYKATQQNVHLSLSQKANRASEWILKAKFEGNNSELARAYRAKMYTGDRLNYSAYADSIVEAAKKSKDDILLANAYMTKGIVHNERIEMQKALDNYLLANELVAKSDDRYMVHKVKYGIAMTKYYLGFYEEAISIFDECANFFRTENDRAYLNSLHMLALTFNRIGNIERSEQLLHLAFETEQDLDDQSMHWYFVQTHGINQYHQHDFVGSRTSLTRSLKAMKVINDIANIATANLYLGKGYIDAGQMLKGISNLMLVDSLFLKHQYTRPDLREAYELIIEHHKNNNDKNLQLTYINKLLTVDSVLAQNYRYLSANVYKQYDTRELIDARDKIESDMRNFKVTNTAIILLLASVISVLAYRHFTTSQRYRRKYTELMQRVPDNSPPAKIFNSNKSEISADVVEAILKQLKKFETSKKFLEKDMTLSRLATILHTNTKYAGKITLMHRGKRSIDYIRDLKIDHITMLLKENKRFRKYTNEALANEVGFGSTQNFTNAFKSRNGISPTYFIEQLQEDEKKDL